MTYHPSPLPGLLVLATDFVFRCDICGRRFVFSREYVTTLFDKARFHDGDACIYSIWSCRCAGVRAGRVRSRAGGRGADRDTRADSGGPADGGATAADRRADHAGADVDSADKINADGTGQQLVYSDMTHSLGGLITSLERVPGNKIQIMIIGA